jgi:hypothetical protein
VSSERGKTALMFSGVAVLYGELAWLLSLAAGHKPKGGQQNNVALAVEHSCRAASMALWLTALGLALLGVALRVAVYVATRRVTQTGGDVVDQAPHGRGTGGV